MRLLDLIRKDLIDLDNLLKIEYAFWSDKDNETKTYEYINRIQMIIYPMISEISPDESTPDYISNCVHIELLSHINCEKLKSCFRRTINRDVKINQKKALLLWSNICKICISWGEQPYEKKIKK